MFFLVCFFFQFALTRQSFSFSENNEKGKRTKEKDRMQFLFSFIVKFCFNDEFIALRSLYLSKTFLNCKQKKNNKTRPTKNPSTRRSTWKNISKILSEPEQKREEQRQKRIKKNRNKNKCSETGMLRLSTYTQELWIETNERKSISTEIASEEKKPKENKMKLQRKKTKEEWQ